MTYSKLEEKIGSQIKEEWHQHKKGEGWVHKNATVDESCFISGIIFSGRVSDNARVYGDARVFGGDWRTSPLFIVGSRFSACNSKYGSIRIGCECHTFDWWEKNGKELAVQNNFTPEEIIEYQAYVELFRKIGR